MYVCHCGVNIAGVVDVKGVAEYASQLENVVVARDYKYVCSDPGQELIQRDIEKYDLNRVVVAACSPRLHEPTFRRCVEEAGLNPYCLEMANIREHCSWVHMDDPARATEKAKDLVRMAVAKARELEPLEEIEVEVTDRALVIGGGVAGIQAALDLADMGFEVILVEKEPSIGGRMAPAGQDVPDQRLLHLHPGAEDGGRVQAPEHQAVHVRRSGRGGRLRGQFHGENQEEATVRGRGRVHGLRRVRGGLPD